VNLYIIHFWESEGGVTVQLVHARSVEHAGTLLVARWLERGGNTADWLRSCEEFTATLLPPLDTLHGSLVCAPFDVKGASFGPFIDMVDKYGVDRTMAELSRLPPRE
jgi:hypothetical protein